MEEKLEQNIYFKMGVLKAQVERNDNDALVTLGEMIIALYKKIEETK
ncbi:hypothetical protein OEZ77_25905 [Leclercia adecarboxylata]|nr:hypothetical protein [Leclercia adecarboxylata]MDC6689969.1 hypothetical protein [Leclercia adecarboxylata]